MKQTIPIMFCFNDAYAAPAAVTFRSLLENASKDYFYKLFVLHTEISSENRKYLQDVILDFQHASLEFYDMHGRFEDLWKDTRIKGHYSKEAYYKLVAPSIFPEYEKIIISDVDVVFLGDISASYFSFDVYEDIYVAGVRGVGKIMYIFDVYKDTFSEEEIRKFAVNAGYMIYNLRKMRKDDIEAAFIRCAKSNHMRVRQLEQDVINLCCHPKFRYLPLNNMMCNYVYELYKTDQDFDSDSVFSRIELKEAMENPILLHYPGANKPWNDKDCTKAEEWFKFVAKTPFADKFYGLDWTQRFLPPRKHAPASIESTASFGDVSLTHRGMQAALIRIGKLSDIIARVRRWKRDDVSLSPKTRREPSLK